MKQKKARYVMQALQSGCTGVNDIVEYIKNSDYIGYMFDYHVRQCIEELYKYSYITKQKIGRNFTLGVLKEVSSQSQIVLHGPIEGV